MALSDPFQTTYQGSQQALGSYGNALTDIAGLTAQNIQKKKQMDNTQNMLKQLGVLQEQPADVNDYENALSFHAKQIGLDNMQVTGSDDPEERKNQIAKILKASGLPLPQPKGYSFNADRAAKLGVAYDPQSGGLTIKPPDKNDALANEMKAERLADSRSKQQDLLEKNYTATLEKQLSNRSGGLGLQDAKVNSGIHALTLLDQTYNPQTKEFNIPPMLQAELAANINNTISNTGVTADAMRQDLIQRSAYGDWNKTMQYILNTPENSLPKDNAKLLVDTIARQGPISQKLRDKYQNDLKSLAPTGLSKDRIDRINKTSIGSDFNESLKNSSFYNDLYGGGKGQSQSGVKIVNGLSYEKGQDGIWHRQK